MNSTQKKVLVMFFVLGASLGALTVISAFPSMCGQRAPAPKETTHAPEKKQDASPQQAAPPPQETIVLQPSTVQASAPSDGDTDAEAEAQAAQEGSAVAQFPADWHKLEFSVQDTLYASVAAAVAPLGYDQQKSDTLGAHIKRIIMWKLPQISSDVYKNDKVVMVFKEDPEVSDGFRILALHYTSGKLNQTIRAYYFKPEGANWGRFYDQNGVEIAKRPKNAPVKNYEAIIALLGDGRRHKGVDFKADIGEPVYTPFNARVVRRNWATRANGNCLELRYADSGVTAIFLHLNTVSSAAKVGAFIKAGTKIGEVGNTGHSFAPHLHYQLEKPEDHAIDPIKWHGYDYPKLNAKDLADLRKAIQPFQNM